MKLIGKIITAPFLIANWIISLLMVFSSFGSMAAPIGRWPFAALSGLAFPFLLLIEVLFIVMWLLTWKKGAFISIATILICIVPVLRYCPLNFFNKSDAQPDLEIITFNCEFFGYGYDDEYQNVSAYTPQLEYITSKGADVILFQEARKDIMTHLDNNRELVKKYPYHMLDRAHKQACISRYPILDQEIIEFKGASGNSCQYLRILIGNDTLAVYNCHLQTTRIGQDEYDDYHRVIESRSEYELYHSSKKVVGKLLNTTGLRAIQAELVAEKAKVETAKYLIVCGDFNDTPLSYSFHVFDKFMTDVYGKVGIGPGITYHEHHLNYRIDHMFCNGNLTPVSSRVDRECEGSDHWPVISQFKLNK